SHTQPATHIFPLPLPDALRTPDAGRRRSLRGGPSPPALRQTARGPARPAGGALLVSCPCQEPIGRSRVGSPLLQPQGERAALPRSEEHTSELQSLTNPVCRPLL